MKNNEEHRGENLTIDDGPFELMKNLSMSAGVIEDVISDLREDFTSDFLISCFEKALFYINKAKDKIKEAVEE